MNKKDYINKVKTSKIKKFSIESKIDLNKFDEIEESLNHADYLVNEAFVEAMDIGDEKYMLGRDIMRFDFNDALGEAEYQIDEIKSTLDGLGVDYPSELQNVIDRLKELEEERIRSRNRFAHWESIY